MKKFYKGLGVALVAAMALTATPINGTFVKPAIVKANTALQTALTATGKAFVYDIGTKKDMLELTSADLFGNSGTIASNKADYKFAWVQSSESALPSVATDFSSVNFESDKFKIALEDGKTKLIIQQVSSSANIGSLEFMTGGEAPNVTANSDEPDTFTGITEEHEYRIKNEATPTVWTSYSNAHSNKPNPNVAEGTVNQVYEVRTKGTATKFPSAKKEVTLSNPAKLVKADVTKLKYELTKDNKIKITNVAEAIKDKASSTPLKVKNGDSEAEVLKVDKEFAVEVGKSLMLFAAENLNDNDYQATKGHKITVSQDPKLLEANVEISDKSFTLKSVTATEYIYRKHGSTDDFTAITEEKTELQNYGDYEVRKKGTDFTNVNNPTAVAFVSGTEEVQIKLHSEPYKITLSAPQPPAKKNIAIISSEETQKAEENKKLEESKKTEAKIEETKKEETKSETSKKEEPKAEENKEIPFTETAKPVAKTVKETKKTVANASTKSVQAVLDGKMGSKLTIAVKSASVILPKTVLEAVFGGVAEKVKVDVKTMAPKKSSKDAKLVSKNLKKNKLVSKTVYNLMVKVGSDSLNDYDLQGGEFTVALKTNLKKAPKNLYVMNIANGKLMKAGFKKGEVTFKAGMTGKFVVVSK